MALRSARRKGISVRMRTIYREPAYISNPTDRISSMALLFRTTPGRSS